MMDQRHQNPGAIFPGGAVNQNPPVGAAERPQRARK
jgi:hypothetical protein